MKKYIYGLMLALGLAAAGPALATCDVTLSAFLPSNQAVLMANCGVSNMTSVIWTRTDSFGATFPTDPITFPATTADLYFTTLLTSGTNSYSATGCTVAGTPPSCTGGTLVAAGKAALITLSQPILTVAVSPGGKVTSVPPGITDCTNTSGTCVFGYDTGANVALTPTADPGSAFASWGGDCAGTATNAACVLSMTVLRTATATFGAAPTNGACGSSSNSTPVASAPSSNLCSTGTATGVATPSGSPWNFTWGCNGAGGGTSTSATACSAPKIVNAACHVSSTPVSAAPTGTNACDTGDVTTMVAGASNFTWGCTGINGGSSVAAPTCTVPITSTPGVCGSANGGNSASTPTSAAACTSGTITNMLNPSFTYTWTCNGLAGGGNSGTCTANQTVNGACGTSSGGSFASAPSTNLCVAGTNATAVSGSGPWTWGCNGINGGTSTTATTCSATLSGGGGGGGSTDPGRWTGTWVPPTLADGSANPGYGTATPTLVVVDPSGALGSGTITYTPGCVNQIDPNTGTTCKSLGAHSSGGITVTQAVGRIVAIRVRSTTGAGQWYTIYNKDGYGVSYSVTTSLSIIPGDFNVAANCISTKTVYPKVYFGVVAGTTYCSPGGAFTADTPYYVNVKVNSPACSGATCNFKIVESNLLQ